MAGYYAIKPDKNKNKKKKQQVNGNPRVSIKLIKSADVCTSSAIGVDKKHCLPH